MIFHILLRDHTDCPRLSEPGILKQALGCLLLLDEILQPDGIEDALLGTVLDLSGQQKLVQYKVGLQRHDIRLRAVVIRGS